MLQRLLWIALVLLCARPAVAQEATGKWNASVQTPQGTLPLVIELAADVKILTGTFSTRFVPNIPIQDGTVTGHQVSFTLELSSATLAYTGVVDGDTLTLTHRVVEKRDTNGGQSLGAALMSVESLRATRAR